jgi:hypothetical protein
VPLRKLPPTTDKVATAVPDEPTFILLVVNALLPAVDVNIPPPGRLVSLLPSPSKKDAEILMLAVRSPVILRDVPSNVRFDSHVRVLAFPATFVRIALFVAFETRGTLIILAPSDVLKFPETIFPTTKSPGI